MENYKELQKRIAIENYKKMSFIGFFRENFYSSMVLCMKGTCEYM